MDVSVDEKKQRQYLEIRSQSHLTTQINHCLSENRYITFGLSLQKRLIVVAHTERGSRTRIISARLMDRKERKIYEEG